MNASRARTALTPPADPALAESIVRARVELGLEPDENEKAAYLERQFRRDMKWHSGVKVTFGGLGGRTRFRQ